MERQAWNRHLAAHGWSCVGWPTEHGGRGLDLWQQVIFHEEYARADAPARVNHLGEELLGPTLMAFGTEEQKRRFLPRILAVEELWAQGYSEPDAGSDLFNLSTKGVLEGGEWVVNGQKVWQTDGQYANWIFALVRTEPEASRGAGISMLLLPIDQPGVEVRTIRSMTGKEEFSEVFFSDARTAAENIVGPRGGGAKVALTLLGYERGSASGATYAGYRIELDRLIAQKTAADLANVRRALLGRAQLYSAAQQAYRWARERGRPDAERESGYQDRDRKFI